MTDNGQTSFLGLLDSVHYRHFFHPEIESVKNDCGVYTKNILEYRAGNFTGDYVEVNIALDGKTCYYDYSYSSANDSNYGHGSPLDESSFSFHRNNRAENVRKFIVDTFEHSVLKNDNNVCKPQKAKLLNMMMKLVKEIV